MLIKNNSFYIHTLGCKVNTYESNLLKQKILNEQGIIVKEFDNANIIIINSCCVTNKAISKSKYFINKANKSNKCKLIAIIGCLPEFEYNDLKASKIKIIIGNQNKTQLIDLIKKYKTKPIVMIQNHKDELEYAPIHNFITNSRAFIKIQDGCNYCCSYCIIPRVRGKQKSADNKLIIDNIKQLATNGYKEIVLTGVNTGGYKYKNINLFNLLKQINEIDGEFRIRISSIEPMQIDDQIIDLIIFNKHRFCQHLHICIQNANDEVLKQMNRHYLVTNFIKLVNKIRDRNPLFSITTDYIVGFCTETLEQFKDSIENLNKIRFSNIHLFPFSSMKGTKAFDFKNIVSNTERTRRFKILSELNKK
jgi:threonylcarbamoyladenosine tRNA methylthiotransferase MtaB